MKLRKGLAIFAILGAAGLFAASDMNSVSALVDQINKTTNMDERNILLKKLHDKLIAMDQDDLPAAQDYVSEKLKMTQKLQ